MKRMHFRLKIQSSLLVALTTISVAYGANRQTSSNDIFPDPLRSTERALAKHFERYDGTFPPSGVEVQERRRADITCYGTREFYNYLMARGTTQPSQALVNILQVCKAQEVMRKKSDAALQEAVSYPSEYLLERSLRHEKRAWCIFSKNPWQCIRARWAWSRYDRLNQQADSYNKPICATTADFIRAMLYGK